VDAAEKEIGLPQHHGHTAGRALNILPMLVAGRDRSPAIFVARAIL
jgi:hypothetical protein